MFEIVMLFVLLLLTAVVGVILCDALATKPSLERSQEIFSRSILFVIFGIILSSLWFLLSISAEAIRTECVYFSIAAFTEAILGLFAGLRHWRKYREYTRTTREIEEGLTSTVQAT